MSNILVNFTDFPWLTFEENPLWDILRTRFPVALSDYPDYLFHAHAGNRHRVYSCTKIFYTQECFRPNWRECDYAITSIKVDDPRAFHLPVYSLWCEAGQLIRESGVDWRELARAKTGFCSFVVGYDSRSVRTRSEFFHRLNARQRVASGGRALNNTGETMPPGREHKLEFLRRYKFNIAFENSSIPGYTSEKIVDAFEARTVPIYWGDETVKEQFNPEAFIDRGDFLSDDACIEHILKVDADDELYLKYLSASPFHGNRLNKEWDHGRLIDFCGSIFDSPINPISSRKWLNRVTDWRLVKRPKTHEENGWPNAAQRQTQRFNARRDLNPGSVHD